MASATDQSDELSVFDSGNGSACRHNIKGNDCIKLEYFDHSVLG